MENQEGQAVRPAESSRAGDIARGIRSLSVQSVISTSLGFVLLATLLRFLPALEFGAYSAVQVLVTIVSVLSVFGFGSASVWFLAPSSEEGGGGWGAAKASLSLVLLISGAASISLAGLAPYFSEYFMKSPSWAWVFQLGSLWLFAAALAQVLQRILQGTREYQRLAAILLASRLVAVAVAAVGVILYRSLLVAILSWAVYGLILSAAVFLHVMRPLLKASSRGFYRPVARYAAPIGLANFVTIIASNADVVVVGGYLSPISLGVYNAILTISTAVAAFFVTPLVTAVFAETSFGAGRLAEVTKGAALALRYGVMIVLPASVFVAAVSPQLLEVFSGGGEYLAGAPYLQLIMLFYVFFAVQTISVALLQGTGRTGRVLKVGVVTGAAQVALSLVLVPLFGLEGAAAGRVAVMTSGCVVAVYFLWDHFKGAIKRGFLAKVLFSAGVPGAAVYLLTVAVSQRSLTLLPYSVLGLALYLACVRLTKLLNPEDRSHLANLLPARLRQLVWLL